MSSDSLLYIALGTLVLCWVVGAHNRLVRLKNAVGREYAGIEAVLRQRQTLVAQLLAVGERLPPDLLAAVVQAQRTMQASLEQMHQRPSGSPEALALQNADQRLDEQLAALWESAQTQQAATTDPLLPRLVLELAQLESRLEVIAEPYNHAVQAFNDAAREFPAWLVSQLAGLKPMPGLHLGRGAARLAARPLMVGRRQGDVAPQPPA